MHYWFRWPTVQNITNNFYSSHYNICFVICRSTVCLSFRYCVCKVGENNIVYLHSVPLCLNNILLAFLLGLKLYVIDAFTPWGISHGFPLKASGHGLMNKLDISHLVSGKQMEKIADISVSVTLKITYCCSAYIYIYIYRCL